MNQKNVKYLMLGVNDADIAAAGTTIGGPDDLTEGVLAVVNEQNETVVTEQSSGKVRIVQRVGDELIYSPFIDVEKIRRKVSVDGAAATEQVSYVGYNGSAGSLDAETESDYIIKGIIENVKTAYNNTPFITHWAYRTGTSTSQYAVAAGLIENFNKWKKRFAEKVLQADAVTSSDVTATNDFLGDATVVKGVKAFTVAESVAEDDGGVYATDTEIAVGDFVRIGAVGEGTALTDPVYKVTAVANVSSAAATITVDRPITNASGTYAAGTSDIEVIPAADIGDMGIKFTGIALPTDAETRNYEKVRFELGIMGDFTIDTTVTYDTDPSEGNGTYGQIASLERQAAMNEGKAWVQAYPTISYRSQADQIASADYPLYQVIIDFYDDDFKPLLGDTPKSYATVVIATPNATGAGKLETVFAIS